MDAEVEKSFGERSSGERAVISDAVNSFARLIMEGSPSDIAAFEGKLRGERGGGRVEEVEVRNRLRVFARYREVEGRSLAGSELQKRLGVSRQRLGQLRKEKKLLGVRLPIRREIHYPVWQFGEDGRPIEAMPRLMEAAEEAGLGALALDSLATNPTAVDAGGRSAAELLRSGGDEAEEYVLGVVRASLSEGS